MPRPLHGRPFTGPDYEPLPSGDLRDHAEEAAVRIEADLEAAAELAFEHSQSMLVTALRDLAASSQDSGRRFAAQINSAIAEMRMPDPAHLLFMRRAMTVAHLADRGALTIGRYRGYLLAEQIDALLAAAEANAAPGNLDAVRFACERVRLATRQSIEQQQEAAFAASSGHQD